MNYDMYINIVSNIMVSLLITIAPMFILKWKNYLKKSKNKSFLYSICWSILALPISLIFLSLMKERTIIELIISVISISTLFNYFVLKDYIDIKKIPLGFIIFISFFFISIAEIILADLLHINISTITIKQDLIFKTIIELLFIGIYIFIFRDMFFKKFKDFKKNFNKYLDKGFKYWFIGIIIMVISNLLIIFLTDKVGSTNESSVQNIISSFPLLALFSTGIIGPFVEEICFRFSFKTCVKDKWLFCIISGVVFGLLHVIFTNPSLIDFLYVIPYGALGFSFALMYFETDNIFTNIMMHTFHNFTLTALSIITSLMVVI